MMGPRSPGIPFHNAPPVTVSASAGRGPVSLGGHGPENVGGMLRTVTHPDSSAAPRSVTRVFRSGSLRPWRGKVALRANRRALEGGALSPPGRGEVGAIVERGRFCRPPGFAPNLQPRI